MLLSIGDLVVYKHKNELGLVGEIHQDAARCWYHTGGTRAMTPFHMIKRITFEKALATTFSNEYAKGSLLERRQRLILGDGDIFDLIDSNEVREILLKKINEAKQ